MQYPDPRYFGETGGDQTTPGSGGRTPPPDLVSPPVATRRTNSGRGTAFHYLATGDSTGGDFGLYHVDLGPEIGGPTTRFPPDDVRVVLHAVGDDASCSTAPSGSTPPPATTCTCRPGRAPRLPQRVPASRCRC